MRKRLNYFNTGSWLFWSIFVMVMAMALLRLDMIFDSDGIALRLTENDNDKSPVADSVKPSPIPDSTRKFTWKWKSAKTGRRFVMDFALDVRGIIRADSFQKSLAANSENELYGSLYSHDKSVINSMVEEYKKLAKSEELNYEEAMEMVVSSIQSIEYTWILDRNPSCGDFFLLQMIPPRSCHVKVNPHGCCDGVNFGVYSPVQFAVKRTGDCDTRALFAYTVLKGMGYEVSVMVSNDEHHSVLGVKVPWIPGDGRRGNNQDGRDYYLWELTAYGPVLGQYIRGNDWRSTIK